MAALCVVVLAGWLAWLQPHRGTMVISSASHLRHIEVISDATVTKFYLHNTGYRIRHPPVLLAAMRCTGHWSVTWEGADDVRIVLARGWTGRVFDQPAGMNIAFLDTL